MSRHVMISLRLVLISTILLGLIYPLVITGIAQLIFPSQANGSMIVQNSRIIGSSLIGQTFTRAEYFHPRLSAAGKGYDASASSGSNLAPTSKSLVDRVSADSARLILENPGLEKGRIPVDMVTTSASGLDPDISPDNAYAQAARVASARGIPTAQVKSLIQSNLTQRQFGILGEPRVNVMRINLALDAMNRAR
ncbi:MAG TPA: potassium-transporting ATPase subunit KdpC [Armatimonadota bacterium]